jgi:hypothetical protein
MMGLLQQSRCSRTFSTAVPAHEMYDGPHVSLWWPSRDSPGPSAYDTDSPGKRQLLSDRHRDPAWSMGSGARSDPTGSRSSASIPGVGEIAWHGLASSMFLVYVLSRQT